MEFLYFLESIRTPWLDAIMSAVTMMGGEVAFLVAALVIYWCVNKQQGYYMLSVGFMGTILNQFLKLVFRVERPWVRDAELTIVESARAEATGYSFPSGHTQNAVTIFGTIAAWARRRGVKIGAMLMLALIAFSRMYLGVHTPVDVIVSLALGAALVLALRPLFQTPERAEQWMPKLLWFMLAVAASYVLYVEFFPFPPEVDMENYQEGLKNGYSLFGAVAAMIGAYALEKRKIRFETHAVWWIQILKTALGLVLLLIFKTALKQPLLALCGGHMAAHALRYGIVVFMAAAVWPLTFPYFQRLGKRNTCQKG